jgi:protocatechuate 3,4-dioxygenase alpha subunit
LSAAPERRLVLTTEAANASDQILNLVSADPRQTLIAKKGQGNAYRFDIRMQGGDETVFFEV